MPPRAVLTLSGLVTAAIARDNPALRLTRQIEQGFQVVIWSPDPAKRDAAVSALDAGLSSSTFIPLSDGTQGRFRYVGTQTTDKAENANVYRRDLFYLVEYSTSQPEALTPVLFPGIAYQPGPVRIGALHS